MDKMDDSLERDREHSPPSASGRAVPRQAVVDALRPGAWGLVGGIPLTARTLYHLSKMGMEEVVLLVSADRVVPKLKRWQGKMTIRRVRIDSVGSIPSALLYVSGLDRRFLYVDGSHLVDPRILRALTDSHGLALAFMDRLDRKKEVIRAGCLGTDDLRTWAENGSEALVQIARPLLPQDMDPFSPEIRGRLTPYFVEVSSREDVEKATWLLIRSQQKHVMDLPAEFLDPPFENYLTFRLCQTSITPNMVTMIGVVVAGLVAWLFWHGHFVAGALITFAVEILDGVDGKLARTKLHYTKLGEHEDVIDYLYENSWYVALGVGLSSLAGGNAAPFWAGLLIVADTVDNVLYTLAGKWHGKSIDLFSPFDGAFRRIAGRRNIYGNLFIIGFSLGFPMQTFVLVSIWAAVTATIHGIRLVQFGMAVAVGESVNR
jgi:1L-myo-inositol 1-phosphate cytidylyltransferase / CDP-L-myo-inositol myo-inositolphosphotransferase